MNQRDKENKRLKFSKETTKKENRIISEPEQQKAFNEMTIIEKPPKEENPDNLVEFEAEENLINQRLDYDCLAKIFSYLLEDRLEVKKVCKKWEEAIEISWSNVKKINAHNLQVPINKKESTLEELLEKCCQYLTHLTIDKEYFWILKNNCKNITYFDVKFFCKYPTIIFEIIGSMTKLKCLKARAHDRDDPEFSWNEFSEILPTDIEEIHLFTVERNHLFNQIPETPPVLDKFTNLRCLTLKYFHLTAPIIKSILLSKNSLVYLDLTGCYLSRGCPMVFTQLVNLQHLNLNKIENFNYNAITEIARNCQKLKYLAAICYYSSCSVSRRIFNELKYLNNLEHLVFPRVKSDDDYLISDVFYNCKKLKHLDVGRGENFSAFDIKAITKLNCLQYLDIFWANVDSQLFIDITNNCLELKEIMINFDNFQENHIEKLKNLKKLEKINLTLCINLNGSLLSTIVDNCRNLVDVNLSLRQNLTEDSLIKVGKLDNLKRLNISKIKNVPESMFCYFKKIEKLSCENCPSVNDEAIKKVIDNCLNLSFLNVKGTGITVDTLVHAAKRKISFKILNITVENYLHQEYLSVNGNRPSSPYLKIKGEKP